MMYAALLVAAAAAGASQTTPTPDIVDLDDNITNILSEHEVAVVNFYAPWCAHCIRFEGEFRARQVENGYNRLPLLVVEGVLRNNLENSDNLERQIEGANLLKCSEFGDAIIKNMDQV